MCRCVSVCVLLCSRYRDSTDKKYLQIHAETYTYIQNLHILIYLHFPEMPTTRLHIHAIPTHTDIPTFTYNTSTYLEYLHTQTYLHIPAMPTHTGNTYTYWYTYTYLEYLHIHAIPTHTFIPAHACNAYTYMQIPAHTLLYLHILANKYIYMHIHAQTIREQGYLRCTRTLKITLQCQHKLMHHVE